MTKEEETNLFFKDIIKDIVFKSEYLKMQDFIQHGNTSTYLHSIAISYYSYRFALLFKIKIHTKGLIRGALLHDYYLYDWHAKEKPCDELGLHGFVHPRIALNNAKKEYKLNSIEEDIIISHMFPLTLKLPKYKESYIVCFIDKICSTYEIFKKNSYQKLKQTILNELDN